MPASSVSRRQFLARSAAGAAAVTLGAAPAPARAAASAAKPILMHAGHQHDHSETTLRALAAFGVKNICSGKVGKAGEEAWSVDGLVRLRKHVESFGLKLDCVPLPLSSSYITKSEHPEIMLAKDPERDRTLEHFRQMIRNCGKAGIPMAKYNLTFIGVVRTERTIGRGGASLSTFDYAQSKQEPPLTEAGRITDEIYWDRIGYFLKKLVPVAEEAGVRIACHPQDPAMPPGTGWRGVNTVLGSPAGLRKFVELQASPFHGINFCQGTVCEMLEKPGEQIFDVIREFGRRGKIFNVHFRNIRGGFLKFSETMPDDGDVDMLRALRTYREVGYAGMIMPDHVPQILGDPLGQKAFAFCFGYIQALLQALRAEA
ncbi:MAG: mannonate dehydratase [Opitutaceae bacterium]|nr:mannonate dehydratase [Opitutaceae bacterium]